MPPVDEGMIHAWLDGALDASEAERIAQLVATDPAWGAAAAEARGLIAASSRILSSLDAVPAHVAPAAIPTSSAAREQLRRAPTEAPRPRAWRPQRWAAAAMIAIAVGAGGIYFATPGEVRTSAGRTPLVNEGGGVNAKDVAAAAAPAISASGGGAASPAGSAMPTAAAGPQRSGAGSAVTPNAGGMTPATPREPVVGDQPRPRDARDVRAPTINAPAAAPAAATQDALAKKEARNEARQLASEAPQPAPAAPEAKARPSEALVTRNAAPAAALAEKSVTASGGAASGAMGASLDTRGDVARRAGARDLDRPAAAALSAVSLACWTVRLSGWSPEPSFGVPVGALLDSAQVARALVGSNLPAPPAGRWQLRGDSAIAVIERTVLGYALTVRVSLTTRTGTAVLGDASVPTRTQAAASLLPSRCGAP
ncbi:MAG: hypothetical protein HY275_04130 [Gemmatimonadetes bacterium]|nr:hypothetical protein [Gemmatimonadota bacterium]